MSPVVQSSDDFRQEEELASLVAGVSMEEVRNAVFSMKGLKAPRPDALFYQRHWEVVSQTILQFVQNALQSGSLDVDVLRAHMVLIPKGDNPDSLTKFRPITLLKTSYSIRVFRRSW